MAATSSPANQSKNLTGIGIKISKTSTRYPQSHTARICIKIRWLFSERKNAHSHSLKQSVFYFNPFFYFLIFWCRLTSKCKFFNTHLKFSLQTYQNAKLQTTNTTQYRPIAQCRNTVNRHIIIITMKKGKKPFSFSTEGRSHIVICTAISGVVTKTPSTIVCFNP